MHSGPNGLLRWLSEGAFALLAPERVVQAPFLTLVENEDSASAKTELTGSTLCVPPSGLPIASSNEIARTLGQLRIPYIQNVPLDLLVRVLQDEEDSVAGFRRVLYRALEDVRDAPNPHDAQHVLKKLQREQIDDELRLLHEACERITRRNSLARIGAYVGTGGLTIGALLGLDAAAIVCGVSGVTGAAITEAFRYFEDCRMLRQSPLYLVWRLGTDPG